MDTSLSGLRVGRDLDRIAGLRSCRSGMVISDNGTGLTSRAILRWREDRSGLWYWVAPGKLQQNRFVESVNSRFGDECLNAHLFGSLTTVRGIIEAFRIDDNATRPHTRSNGLASLAFATCLGQRNTESRPSSSMRVHRMQGQSRSLLQARTARITRPMAEGIPPLQEPEKAAAGISPRHTFQHKGQRQHTAGWWDISHAPGRLAKPHRVDAGSCDLDHRSHAVRRQSGETERGSRQRIQGDPARDRCPHWAYPGSVLPEFDKTGSILR